MADDAKCRVCLKLPANYTLQRCKHVLCLICLNDHIHRNLSTAKIKCPIPNCTRFLSDVDIRRFLSPDEEQSYDLLCCSPNAKRCITPTCNYVYFVEGGNLVFQCPNCEQPNCLFCNKRHYPSECSNSSAMDEVSRDEMADRVLKDKRTQELLDYDIKNMLIPNPILFDCPMCGETILPRVGVLLRNCGDMCCRDCLQSDVSICEKEPDLKCGVCGMDLCPAEIRELMKDDDKYAGMLRTLVAPKFTSCMTPDCDGCFDVTSETSFRCITCKKVNCLVCYAMHDGKTCDEFKKSKQYEQGKVPEEIKKMRNVRCQCGKTLIQKGGCGALYCDHCGIHVCVFTGLKVGPEGCKCTPKKPCHPDCQFGCMPD